MLLQNVLRFSLAIFAIYIPFYINYSFGRLFAFFVISDYGLLAGGKKIKFPPLALEEVSLAERVTEESVNI